MEDAITNNSKKAPALEKEGMIAMSYGGGGRGEEKRLLYFVCTQFIFMRWDAMFYMRRLYGRPLSLYLSCECIPSLLLQICG